MNLKEAIDFIHSLERLGTKLGLETTTELLKRVGNPHEKLKFIHVAGTNGKGSTSSFIANSLTAAGYKTGIYISPFVNKFNERIQIDGQYIPDEALARYTSIIKDVIDDTCCPTEFEVVTAIGMMHFAESGCDYVVLEVGLGGRFDATNVISVPEVAVITSISIDHTDMLGDTVERIAYEKCGIIKQNGVVVAYADNADAVNRLISDTAKEKNCKLTICDSSQIEPLKLEPGNTLFRYKGETYCLKMLGKHQIFNAVTAIEALKALGIPDTAIKAGLFSTNFGGRLELISDNPTILIDGAHNYSGVTALKSALTDYFPDKKITLVMGMLKDKEYEKCISEIAPLAHHFIATEPENPRKLDADSLATLAKKFCSNVHAEKNKLDAVKAALETDSDVICVCGSLYLIGNIFNK